MIMRFSSLWVIFGSLSIWVHARTPSKNVPYDSDLTLQDLIRQGPQRVPGDLTASIALEDKFLGRPISKSDQNALDSPHEENNYDSDPEHGGTAVYTEYTSDNRKLEKVMARRADQYYSPPTVNSGQSQMEMALEELKKMKPAQYQETVREIMADLGNEVLDILMAYVKRAVQDEVKIQAAAFIQAAGLNRAVPSQGYPYAAMSGTAYNPYAQGMQSPKPQQPIYQNYAYRPAQATPLNDY